MPDYQCDLLPFCYISRAKMYRRIGRLQSELNHFQQNAQYEDYGEGLADTEIPSPRKSNGQYEKSSVTEVNLHLNEL